MEGGIGGDCLKLVDSAEIVGVNGWYVKTGALREYSGCSELKVF